MKPDEPVAGNNSPIWSGSSGCGLIGAESGNDAGGSPASLATLARLRSGRKRVRCAEGGLSLFCRLRASYGLLRVNGTHASIPQKMSERRRDVASPALKAD